MTDFKKPDCGDMHQSGGEKVQAHIRDVLGGLINFQIVGTDPDQSGMITSPLAADYEPTDGTLNPDGTFFICIESGSPTTFAVELADGTDFTITPGQATAYLGQWYPARIKRVYAVGTTGNFSVGY